MLAYDGKKSAFAAGLLPFDSKEFVVNLTQQTGKELDHLRQFLAGRRQDYPQETIQALDVVLRVSAFKGRKIVGRSLADFGRGSLGDGIEYWKGFYQSLRPTQMGLSLNIDMTARAVYESKLVSEFVGELLGRDMSRSLTEQERIKVFTRLSRYYSLIVQYLREKYNTRLRFPDLPAIQAGRDAKPIYLTMEICRVTPGQRYALKLNETQVTRFLRATCQRPKDREESIYNTMRHNEYNKDPLVSKDFEMNVTELLTSIEACVLPPPTLRYHESGRYHDVNSAESVINGGTVNFWATISFSEQTDRAFDRFVKGLVSMSRIKRLCETELGIVSLCFKPEHVEMMSDHYLQNVALKINVKVGGRNNVMSACLNRRLPYVTDRPTIIFGADVTHSRPGEDCRRRCFDELAEVTKELLLSFKKATGHKPHHLIFYRDGVSEGQFSEALPNEMDKTLK
ncbi:protein argonaute 5, partial [Tanacetum coccineum]